MKLLLVFALFLLLMAPLVAIYDFTRWRAGREALKEDGR